MAAFLKSSFWAFAATILTCPAYSYPSSGEASSPNELSRRSGTTSFFGDYTGSTSQYPDGSGVYQDSRDVGTYISGVKCWTDLVSAARQFSLSFIFQTSYAETTDSST